MPPPPRGRLRSFCRLQPPPTTSPSWYRSTGDCSRCVVDGGTMMKWSRRCQLDAGSTTSGSTSTSDKRSLSSSSASSTSTDTDRRRHVTFTSAVSINSYVYTAIKTVRVSVTEVGVAGSAWPQHTLSIEKQTWIGNCNQVTGRRASIEDVPVIYSGVARIWREGGTKLHENCLSRM